MVVLLLSLLAYAGPESGDDSPGGGSGGTPASTQGPRAFGDLLAHAKTLYFQGQSDEALELLLGLWLRIESGEQVTFSHAAEAMIYLGEIQHIGGDRVSADAAFRWVLERDLEYPVSPFHHPIEVVRTFDSLRQQVQAERVAVGPPPPIEVPPPPALPLWGYAPFGLPQFNQDQNGRGTLYLALQTGMAATSIAMFVHLGNLNNARHPPRLGDDQVFRYVNERRYGVQWPATVGFYAVWLASYVDGRQYWRRPKKAAPAKAGVAVTPRPDGGDLVIGIRY